MVDGNTKRTPEPVSCIRFRIARDCLESGECNASVFVTGILRVSRSKSTCDHSRADASFLLSAQLRKYDDVFVGRYAVVVRSSV